MFCPNCGREADAGKAFCENCGAQLAGPEDQPTEVRGRTPSPPPPPAPRPRRQPPPPPPPPGAGTGAGGAWQPSVSGAGPGGAPPSGGRTGLIIGIAIAIIVVLGGGGTAALLMVRGDAMTVTTSTQVVLSTTSTITAASTSIPTVTTIGGAQATTSQTIPDLGTTTTETLAPGQTVEAYLTATDNLVQVLVDADQRIPVLAVTINNTAPNVPRGVWDELQTMMGELDASFTSLGEVSVPSEFMESNGWLTEAAMAMGNRIDATISGIEAMWDAGSVSAGTTYFDLGRQARDEYRANFEKFHDTVPID